MVHVGTDLVIEMLRKARQQHNRKAKQHINTLETEENWVGGIRTHDTRFSGNTLTNYTAKAAQLAGRNHMYKALQPDKQVNELMLIVCVCYEFLSECCLRLNFRYPFSD